MYVNHRFNFRDRIFSKASTRSNAIRPALQVPQECPINISQKLSKRCHLIRHGANELSETPPKVPQKSLISESTQATSSSAASEPSYANTPRFVMTDTTR